MACTLPACAWVNNPGLLLSEGVLDRQLSESDLRGGEKMKNFSG